MSILITGIDMPTKGNPITVLIYPDGTAEWEAQNKVGTAIPVLKHGRLIDADALIRRIEFETRYYVVKDKFDKGRVAGWKNTIMVIREYAPTVIPADPPKEET